MAAPLPLGTRFSLGNGITPEQRSFLDEHGFLVFSKVARTSEVQMIVGELDRRGPADPLVRETRRRLAAALY